MKIILAFVLVWVFAFALLTKNVLALLLVLGLMCALVVLAIEIDYHKKF